MRNSPELAQSRVREICESFVPVDEGNLAIPRQSRQTDRNRQTDKRTETDTQTDSGPGFHSVASPFSRLWVPANAAALLGDTRRPNSISTWCVVLLVLLFVVVVVVVASQSPLVGDKSPLWRGITLGDAWT